MSKIKPIEILDDFKETLINQSEKGIKKYGQPIDDTMKLDWGKQAKEELVDAYTYILCLEKERERIKKVIKELNDIISKNDSDIIP